MEGLRDGVSEARGQSPTAIAALAELAAGSSRSCRPRRSRAVHPARRPVVGAGSARRTTGQRACSHALVDQHLRVAYGDTWRQVSATAGTSTRPPDRARHLWAGGTCLYRGQPSPTGALSLARRWLPGVQSRLVATQQGSRNDQLQHQDAPGRCHRLGCPVSRRQAREEAAHRFADAGWHVFPAEPGGKRPATDTASLTARPTTGRSSNGGGPIRDSTSAVATGAPGPDVLDVDKHKDGNGFGAFNQLKRAGLVRDPMAIVRTPSGGFHAYYKGTEPAERPHPGRVRGLPQPGRLCGRAAVHGSPAGMYEVARKQPTADTFDWAAAKQVLDPQPERQPYKPPERTGDRPRDLCHLPGWVASQPEGNRNHGLFWAVVPGRRGGRRATLDSLASAARAAGLDDREIDRTIASAQQTAGRGRRAGLLSTPAAVAPRRPRSRTRRPRPRQAP